MKKRLTQYLAVLLASILFVSSFATAAAAEISPVSELAETAQYAEELPEETVIADETPDSSEESEIQTTLPEETVYETESEELPADVAEEAVIETEEAAPVEAIAEETEAEAETEAETEAVEEEASEFAELTVTQVITVTDKYANAYHPFAKSSNEGVLFVSSDIDIASMSCVLDSRISAASAGTIAEGGILTGAFKKSGDKVTLTAADGGKFDITVMKSSLPTLHITLNGTTIQKVNAGSKDTKYSGNSVTIYDPSGNSMKATTAELKGRGNTTWAYADKKPYQIKFDKKQSVLGMDKAKKWILLANSFDDSLLRNAIGLTLAKQLGMTCAPDFRFIDLFVDGEYLGNYVICEKCEFGTGRVEASDDNAVLMEYDQFFYRDEAYWTKDPFSGLYFSLKETNTDGNEVQQMKYFTDKLDALMNYVYSTPSNAITIDNLKKYLDVESMMQYVFTTDFTANVESWATSFFWYMDGPSDVLHMGPVWDFDSSLGNKVGYSDCNKSTLYLNSLVTVLFNIPCVNSYAQNYLAQKRAILNGAASIAQKLGNENTASAEMNYIRWDYLGKPAQKVDTYPFKDTYKEAVSALVNWLNNRASVYTISNSFEVSKGVGTINLVCKLTNVSSVRVAVWSNTGGQDDLHWVDLSKAANGTWVGSVPISAFLHDGFFSAHFYSGSTMLGNTYALIKEETNCDAVQNGWLINGNIYTDHAYDSISTAVWSEVNGQDDLKWYPATSEGSGRWSYTADLSKHVGTGSYAVHVYGFSNGKATLIDSKTFNITPSNLLIYNKVDYSKVMSYTYYKNRYSDVAKAFGNSYAALARHFILYGMKEGRQGNADFVVKYYQANYPDLKKSFGNDLPRYYAHYCNYGAKEGREAKNLKPVYNGVDYSPVYNFTYYTNRYSDLKKAFGSDQIKAFNHFVESGMKEGRQANESFNCSIYKARYADLRKAFGNDNAKYYKHYCQFGMKEGRSAI